MASVWMMHRGSGAAVPTAIGASADLTFVRSATLSQVPMHTRASSVGFWSIMLVVIALSEASSACTILSCC